MLRGSPATSRTTWPACSASAASSVPLPPCAPSARAAGQHLARNACGVCASQTRSRGMVASTRALGRIVVRQLHRVARGQRRDGRARLSIAASIVRSIVAASTNGRAASWMTITSAADRSPRSPRHGVLPPCAAGHEAHRLVEPGEERRRAVEHVGRQRHDDLRHARMRHECGDAALENRAAADRQELLRRAGAEPAALSSGGDDGDDTRSGSPCRRSPRHRSTRR